MMREKLKLLDLFSGIGGFSLGLESTGYFETIGFVEKDKFCQKVLKKNFNNIPIESEVREMSKEKDTKQMSLLGDSLVLHSAILDKENQQVIKTICGEKCLELLKKLKQNGLLQKMCMHLLISQMEKSCKESIMIFKVVVTKSKLLILVLDRKEQITKDQDYLYSLPTPTTQDARIGINNIGGNKHRVKRGSIALADKILFQFNHNGEKRWIKTKFLEK